MYDMGLFLNALFIIINLGTITIFIKYSLMFFGKAETEADYNKYDLWKQVPIMVLGLLCLGFGIFGESIILYLLNADVRINMGGYIEKSVIFALSFGTGFLIYKYGIKDRPILEHIATIDLGFRGMCAALGVFFATILIVVRFVM
jgi:multicomponent Na+:H+ antiporter subunit D